MTARPREKARARIRLGLRNLLVTPLVLWAVLAACTRSPGVDSAPASSAPTSASTITATNSAVSPPASSVGGAVPACPVTLANGNPAPGEQPSPNWHGNGVIWTVPWPEGRVEFRKGGSGFISPDGSLSMKFPMWWRNVGELAIEGHRLDSQAPPLRATLFEGSPSTLPSGYRFSATALIFPTEGCWEVTAGAGGASLTFVTLVVKV